MRRWGPARFCRAFPYRSSHWCSTRKSSCIDALDISLLFLAQFRSVLEAYGDPVPGIHECDGVGDVGGLLVIVVAPQRLERRVGGVRHLDMGERLGPFERSLFRFGEIGTLPPSGEAIEAGIGLTSLPQVARVFID